MNFYFSSSLKKSTSLFALTLTVLILSCRSQYPVHSPAISVVEQSGSLAHGRQLTMAICAPCHYSKEAQSFIGKEVFGMPRLAGRLHSGNLTHSATHGLLSQYTDAGLVSLIRTGIAKDGRLIPYMMRPNIADEDLNDIIVFLRSADPSLRARDTTAGQSRLTAAGRMGQALLLRPQIYSNGIRRPAASDSIALGRYLVDNIGCYHCHSKSVMSLDYRYPERSKGYLAGGTKFISHDGKLRTPNILFDMETGIGDYSKEDLRQVLQQGIAKDGHRLRAPAEVFHVSDEESDAIYAYLKSLPPVHHRVRRAAVESRETRKTVAR